MRAMRDERKSRTGKMRESVAPHMSQRVTIEVRSFELLSVALFPAVSPVSLEPGIGDCNRLGLERAGGVLVFQLLA